MTRIALFQSTTGIDPEVNARALDRRGRTGGRRRRGDAVYARNVRPARPRRERGGEVLRPQEDDRVLAACSRGRGQAPHLAAYRIARGAGRRRQIGQSGFVIDREGEVRATYDKIHLFDVDLPTGESWRESTSIRLARRGPGQWHAGRQARAYHLL